MAIGHRRVGADLAPVLSLKNSALALSEKGENSFAEALVGGFAKQLVVHGLHLAAQLVAVVRPQQRLSGLVLGGALLQLRRNQQLRVKHELLLRWQLPVQTGFELLQLNPRSRHSAGHFDAPQRAPFRGI